MTRGKDKPTISVIIPTYNRAERLQHAMASVLRQTCGDFELIVVDNGSTDNTREIVTNTRDARIHYISHPTNCGAAVARNIGIRGAKGEFIGFLDDDDEWLPCKLEKQLDTFRNSRSNVGVVYSGSSIISDRSGRTIHSFASHSPGHKDIDFLRTVTFSTSVPLIRKSCFLDVGLFDETLPGAQDKDMWIRLAKHYEFGFVPEILVKRYIHGEQISADLKIKIEAKEKIYRKYFDVLSLHPDIMADHLWRIGILYCIDGRSAEGMRCFWKAILRCPSRRELYRDFALSFAAPQTHRRLLLANTIENIDGIRLYC
ncbi:MAG: glycosyltransferase [Nitrospirota bacterium]|nr:glycosyltransferase [Nitrospirota bacterium]